MGTITVAESAIIDASPQAVYEVIADYRVGHAAILPKPYFEEMTVVKGGRGAGTELRLRMKVFGQTIHYHQIVSEPEPGRVIEEREIGTDQVTTFTFDPVDDGQRTRVTITSLFPVEPGIKGILQRLTQPPVTRRLYRQELQNLAEYLREDASSQATASHSIA